MRGEVKPRSLRQISHFLHVVKLQRYIVTQHYQLQLKYHTHSAEFYTSSTLTQKSRDYIAEVVGNNKYTHNAEQCDGVME